MTIENNIVTLPDSRLPRLSRLFAAGILRVENGEIVGTAIDGVEVSIGVFGALRELRVAENYLAAHPTPADW